MATPRPSPPAARTHTHPDSFFEHDAAPTKKRPQLLPASMSSLFNKKDDGSTPKPLYTSNSTNNGFLRNVAEMRISAPTPANFASPNPGDFSRPKSNTPPSRTLGMGAEVVRTPNEALAGLASPSEMGLMQMQQQPYSSTTTGHGRQSSKDLELTCIPERSRSPRASRSTPHLKQRSNSSNTSIPPPLPSSPPKSAPSVELPPLPSLRPITHFSPPSPPPKAKVSTTTTPKSRITYPPPPFTPVLLQGPPAGAASVPADQQLVTLETASGSLTTTMATISATPSRLATYLSTLVPLVISPTIARSASNSPVTATRPKTPESPGNEFAVALRAHQEQLRMSRFGLGRRESLAGSSDSESSVYPGEEDDEYDDVRYQDDADAPAPRRPSAVESNTSTTPTVAPTSPSPTSLPRLRTTPSTAPLRTSSTLAASRRINIFLDRPTAPYMHILAFLRSLSSSTIFTTAPSLPRSLAQMPASSAARMDALLEVLEEARWLGMHLLEQVCEEEVLRRREERAIKLSSGAHSPGRLAVKKGEQYRESVSSGHETAVESQASSSSRPPSSTYSAENGGDVFGFSSVQYSPPRASASSRIAPAAPSSGLRFAASSTSSLPLPLNAPAATMLSHASTPAPVRPTPTHSHSVPVQVHSITPGHTRFPRSVDASIGGDYASELDRELGVLTTPPALPQTQPPVTSTVVVPGLASRTARARAGSVSVGGKPAARI